MADDVRPQEWDPTMSARPYSRGFLYPRAWQGGAGDTMERLDQVAARGDVPALAGALRAVLGMCDRGDVHGGPHRDDIRAAIDAELARDGGA